MWAPPESWRGHRYAAQGQHIDIALSFSDGSLGRPIECLQSCRRPARRGPLDGTTSSVRGTVEIPSLHRPRRARFRGGPVPAFPVKVEGGRVLVNLAAPTRRQKSPHPPHPLARGIEREPGPVRVAGISTTAMDKGNPRFSGSDHLLREALEGGGEARRADPPHPPQRSQVPLLRGLLLQGGARLHLAVLDHADGREGRADRVYEALVHWADVVLIATPIRWGAGQLALFPDGRAAQLRAEPGHDRTTACSSTTRSRASSSSAARTTCKASPGRCSASSPSSDSLSAISLYRAFARLVHEDMENNVVIVRQSTELAQGAHELAGRLLDLAGQLIVEEPCVAIERGGRKASPV